MTAEMSANGSGEPMAALPAASDPDPTRFRQVLGHFCTGVTIITTMSEDGPAGFACQAFAALSLDPPLVLFCPSRASSTWRRIAEVGYFCANVLASDQQGMARTFGAAGADKFAGVSWSPSSTGAPVLADALTWVGCVVEAVHDGGDHHVVIGRVTELGECRTGQPLLFYRGRFTHTEDRTADGPPEVVDTLLAWPRHVDWI